MLNGRLQLGRDIQQDSTTAIRASMGIQVILALSRCSSLAHNFAATFVATFGESVQQAADILLFNQYNKI